MATLLHADSNSKAGIPPANFLLKADLSSLKRFFPEQCVNILRDEERGKRRAHRVEVVLILP